MTKLTVFYDLEGSLVTEVGNKLEPHFKNVKQAVAFIEKWSFLYEFRGVRYSLEDQEKESDFRNYPINERR